MPNIGSVLREEITRLSRRESRSQIDSTRKAAAQFRHDIATLKRQVAQIERQLALVSRKVLTAPAVANGGNDSAPTGLRYSAKGLRSHRSRLGLSAADFGKLVGVSAQSVYNWEQEAAIPRGAQLVKLAALRTIGKREVAARLEAAAKANGKGRSKE